MSRGDASAGWRGLGLDDRLELRALVDAYALAADQRDGAWFRSLWVSDARLTIHDGDGPARSATEGVEALGEVTVRLARYTSTLHLVANHMCWPGESDADATGEAYCVAHHLSPLDGPTSDGFHDDYVMGIRYVDRYRRDGEGRWRFATREVRRQWTSHEKVRARTARAAGTGGSA